MNALAQIAVVWVLVCAIYVSASIGSGLFYAWQIRREKAKRAAEERELRKMVRALIAEHREAELVLIEPDFREYGED